MKLNELLSTIRAAYTDRLADNIQKCAQQADIVSEVALRDDEDEVVGEGAFNLGARLDIVFVSGNNAGTTAVVESSNQAHFEPVAIEWSPGFHLTLNPFSWDSVAFELTDWKGEPDWTPVIEWFWRWFDEDEANEPDEEGLTGVVHFMSDPDIDDERVAAFAVDLGSAPVDAFDDLLNAISKTGATRVATS